MKFILFLKPVHYNPMTRGKKVAICGKAVRRSIMANVITKKGKEPLKISDTEVLELRSGRFPSYTSRQPNNFHILHPDKYPMVFLRLVILRYIDSTSSFLDTNTYHCLYRNDTDFCDIFSLLPISSPTPPKNRPAYTSTDLHSPNLSIFSINSLRPLKDIATQLRFAILMHA